MFRAEDIFGTTPNGNPPCQCEAGFTCGRGTNVGKCLNGAGNQAPMGCGSVKGEIKCEDWSMMAQLMNRKRLREALVLGQGVDAARRASVPHAGQSVTHDDHHDTVRSGSAPDDNEGEESEEQHARPRPLSHRLLGDDRVIHPVDLDPLTEEEQVQQQDVDAEQRRQVEMDAAVDKVFRDVQ